MAKKTIIVSKLKEPSFLATAPESNNSLHIKEYSFKELVLNKIVYWTFPFVKNIYRLTTKYAIGKLIAICFFSFQIFKLQKQ